MRRFNGWRALVVLGVFSAVLTFGTVPAQARRVEDDRRLVQAAGRLRGLLPTRRPRAAGDEGDDSRALTLPGPSRKTGDRPPDSACFEG